MFYCLQQKQWDILKISLLHSLFNTGCIVLTAIIFITTTFKHVEARDYPVPFPYIIDGLDELKGFVNGMKPQLAVTFQEIELGHDLKVVGVFQLTGSGIAGINTYVYTCEIGECELFLFLRTLENQVSIKLLYETKEMVLKSHKGSIIFRTPFPYLARAK